MVLADHSADEATLMHFMMCCKVHVLPIDGPKGTLRVNGIGLLDGLHAEFRPRPTSTGLLECMSIPLRQAFRRRSRQAAEGH